MCAKTSFSNVELWVLVLDDFVVTRGRVLGGVGVVFQWQGSIHGGFLSRLNFGLIFSRAFALLVFARLLSGTGDGVSQVIVGAGIECDRADGS